MTLSIRPFQSSAIPKPPYFAKDYTLKSLLDIEVGCGVGKHPIDYCREHPERFLIAIEHTRERFAKFQKNIAAAGELPNLAAVHANAISFITHFVRRQSVDRYFLLYPNPYPKAKHQNRRWHAMPFMSKMIDTLKPDGELIMATNKSDYADEAKYYMKNVWKLQQTECQHISRGNYPLQSAKTHFEKKYLERGEQCIYLYYKKVW